MKNNEKHGVLKYLFVKREWAQQNNLDMKERLGDDPPSD